MPSDPNRHCHALSGHPRSRDLTAQPELRRQLLAGRDRLPATVIRLEWATNHESLTAQSEPNRESELDVGQHWKACLSSGKLDEF
jgi:hypothetical protein